MPSFGIGPAVSMTLVLALTSAGIPALVRASMNDAAPSTWPLYTASTDLAWLPANIVELKNVFGSCPVLLFTRSDRNRYPEAEIAATNDNILPFSPLRSVMRLADGTRIFDLHVVASW